MNIEDHSINIGGSVISSQVGQTMTNCTNLIQQQSPGAKKDLLESLDRDVRAILEKLTADNKDRAPEVSENLEMAVKQATSPTPNRKWYTVSAEGLLEASKWTKEFAGNIGGTLLDLGKNLFGGDYKLPVTVYRPAAGL